jgi:AraC-like DNA-binding protein
MMSILPSLITICEHTTASEIDLGGLNCSVLRGDPLADAPVCSDAQVVHLGNAAVMSLGELSSDRVIRMPCLTDNHARAVMTLFNDGIAPVHLVQCDQAVTMEPGSTVLVDPRYNISLSINNRPGARLLGIWLFLDPNAFERDALKSRFLVAHEATASPLNLAHEYAGGILALGPVHDPAVAQLLARHLTDLISLGLALQSITVTTTGHAHDSRLDLLFREIDARFTDPDFSLDDLARAAGITPRYVQILLAKDNTSFNAEVVLRRLSLARDILMSPRGHNITISDIARACGFATRAYFHRRFRRHFGTTPVAFRKQCFGQGRIPR